MDVSMKVGRLFCIQQPSTQWAMNVIKYFNFLSLFQTGNLSCMMPNKTDISESSKSITV